MIFPVGDDVPLRRVPVVTYVLMALNLAVLLYTISLPPFARELFAVRYGFIPARIGLTAEHEPLLVNVASLAHQAELQLPAGTPREFQLESSWSDVLITVLTAMFVHGGWIHLLGNMWFLWIFGDNVEDRLGPVLYLIFYLVGGLLATACHWLTEPSSHVPIIGASGAIAAVLGAYAVTWPWAKVRCLVFLVIFVTFIELPALLVLGFWFVTQLIEANEGLTLGVDGGVAFWAHVGGFVTGALLMPLVRPRVPTYGVTSSGPEYV
jgi:membrane associated rhomboid family serine protease